MKVIEKVEAVSESPSPSPVTSYLYKAGGVMRVVGQSLAVAAAPSLGAITSGTIETWSASPRGVSLPWSIAMRALREVTQVVGQQQQRKAFDVKIAELDVVIEEQHALIPSPEMKEHKGVEGTRAPPKEDNKLSSEGEQ